VIRRLFWLTVGAAAGALAAVYTLAGIRRARVQLDPTTAPARVTRRIGSAGSRVRHAIDEGRAVTREYESRADHRHRFRPTNTP
jgi:hypothetical protein